jgi:hypothetical protein
VLGAHLVHQPVEVCTACWIDQAKLAIEDRRLRGQCGFLGHVQLYANVFGVGALALACAKTAMNGLLPPPEALRPSLTALRLQIFREAISI